MLDRLQAQLHETYQADSGYDVRDFLITDVRMAKVLGGESTHMGSGETLFVHEDDEGLAMSLYLDEELIDRLESSDPTDRLHAEQLDDVCKVIEGLSHFNYVAWRAMRDQAVTLLELELQAEVDKYVGTMQLAIEQRDLELLHALHGRLFDNPTFREELDDEQVSRYRTASDFAARFCRRLRERMLQRDDTALPELRRFFRLPLPEKISHINAQS